MSSALIIEDETIAAQNLQRLLREVAPDLHIVGAIQSIEESVEFFQQQPRPDLCFMDIHLADGLAFRIFDKVPNPCPIIFTTAYDQYALQAFQTTSIDYLLKPINKEDLRRALFKVEQLTNRDDSHRLEALVELYRQQRRHYKSSFLIPVRDKFIPLPTSDIAFFYLEDKLSRAQTLDGQQYTLDQPLDTLMSQLDPQFFFRANRQYIIAHKAIKEISIWPISKLCVTLAVPTPDRIIISKARVHDFKDWYTRSM